MCEIKVNGKRFPIGLDKNKEEQSNINDEKLDCARRRRWRQ